MAAKKKSRNVRQRQDHDAQEQALETIRLINDALGADPIDHAQLRKLAAVRGLVNHQVRARVWPLLLGIGAQEQGAELTAGDGSAEHRDKSIVAVDVQRSLWAYTEGWTDEQRGVKRASLRRILDAAVSTHPLKVHYYQGLHDVASVLLLVLGEGPAFQALRQLIGCQLRDCTRPTLDAVLELLGLLQPILCECDRRLHDHIAAAGLPPFFALSWHITWFAHNVPDLAQAARLFDLFIASHPLMPLYAAAVVMQAARESILATEDPSELHRLLSNLPILADLTVAEVAERAVHLYRRATPGWLAKRYSLQLRCSTSVQAELLEGKHWDVPNEPVQTGSLPREYMHQLMGWLPSRKQPQVLQFWARLTVSAAVVGIAIAVTTLNRGTRLPWRLL